MAWSPEELIRFLELAKEKGIIEDRPAPKQVEPDSDFQALSVMEEPTPEEILYWATPYYDELMAQKEAKKERLEEEKLIKDS